MKRLINLATEAPLGDGLRIEQDFFRAFNLSRNFKDVAERRARPWSSADARRRGAGRPGILRDLRCARGFNSGNNFAAVIALAALGVIAAAKRAARAPVARFPGDFHCDHQRGQLVRSSGGRQTTRRGAPSIRYWLSSDRAGCTSRTHGRAAAIRPSCWRGRSGQAARSTRKTAVPRGLQEGEEAWKARLKEPGLRATWSSCKSRSTIRRHSAGPARVARRGDHRHELPRHGRARVRPHPDQRGRLQGAQTGRRLRRHRQQRAAGLGRARCQHAASYRRGL